MIFSVCSGQRDVTSRAFARIEKHISEPQVWYIHASHLATVLNSIQLSAARNATVDSFVALVLHLIQY